MRRLFANAVCFTFILFLLLFLPVSVTYAESLLENFDETQLPQWDLSPEAIVTGGILQVGPANFAAPSGEWQQFEMKAKMRYKNPGELQIQYQSTEKGFYNLIIFENEALLLKEMQGEGPTELAITNIETLAEDQWFELTIAFQNNSHNISIDGNSLIAVEDPNPYLNGNFLFAAHGQRILEIDSLEIKPLQTNEPPVSEVTEEIPGEDITESAPSTSEDSLLTLLQSLSGDQGNTFRIEVFAINLLLAVFTSFVLSRAYIFWGKSLSNRRKFAANFMMITVTTTFIILVVRSSVALSLGLVGALSIIRFRAAIKEPEELAYLFLAIGLGIGLGDNQRTATLLALAVVIIVIGLSHLFRQTQADTNLHLTISSPDPHHLNIEEVSALLGRYCSKMRLLRYDQNHDVLEMSFVVEFRHTSDLNKLQRELEKLSPSIEISFLDNKGVW